MISADHPFFFLSPALREREGTCTVSKYVYTPDSIFDQRTSLQVPTSALSESWIDQLLNTLLPDEELAFHSNLSIRGRTWHVPMIDFAAPADTVAAAVDRLRMCLPRDVYQGIAFFASGRSLHAYSLAVLSPREWIEFKGRLLLANPREGKELVDTRWIGHRLLGGFSSLRWSKNTTQYLDYPRRFPVPL